MKFRVYCYKPGGKPIYLDGGVYMLELTDCNDKTATKFLVTDDKISDHWFVSSQLAEACLVAERLEKAFHMGQRQNQHQVKVALGIPLN